MLMNQSVPSLHENKHEFCQVLTWNISVIIMSERNIWNQNNYDKI